MQYLNNRRNYVWCVFNSSVTSDILDCNPPGSNVHGIIQARILEWVTVSQPNVCVWKGKWGLFVLNSQRKRGHGESHKTYANF